MKPCSPGTNALALASTSPKLWLFRLPSPPSSLPPEMQLEGQEEYCMPSLAYNLHKTKPRGGVTLRINQRNDVRWPAGLSSLPDECDGGPQAGHHHIASPHPQLNIGDHQLASNRVRPEPISGGGQHMFSSCAHNSPHSSTSTDHHRYLSTLPSGSMLRKTRGQVILECMQWLHPQNAYWASH